MSAKTTARKNLNVTTFKTGHAVAYVCKGCGSAYRSARGVRSHQSQPNTTLACKPMWEDEMPVTMTGAE